MVTDTSSPLPVLDRARLAALIDHTLLKPEATPAQIERLCAEARAYGFAAVCVNPAYVRLAARLLRRSGVTVCSVVGFPLGASLPDLKAHEAERVVALGAGEVDMVLNIGALKAGDDRLVARDIGAVVRAARAGGARVKVIIEACLLTDAEKRRACQIAQKARADFVKTSTGLSTGGATVADVALLRATVGPRMGVKAAGGIRSLADAQAMVAAGATRLGTSAGVALLEAAPVAEGVY
ncbi:MAG: deoxyribose-phosphate aldolase [Anaerolineales bacterium]|nr:deoxyribose-phosphate aldolase [Anaerolineales bacterium]